jgi:carboxymethylenebutenolidase
LTASVEGHFAENDDFWPPDVVRSLESELKGMGKDVTFHIYPGTGHGFTNQENPLGSYDTDATELAWGRAVAHLRAHI